MAGEKEEATNCKTRRKKKVTSENVEKDSNQMDEFKEHMYVEEIERLLFFGFERCH